MLKLVLGSSAVWTVWLEYNEGWSLTLSDTLSTMVRLVDKKFVQGLQQCLSTPEHITEHKCSMVPYNRGIVYIQRIDQEHRLCLWDRGLEIQPNLWLGDEQRLSQITEQLNNLIEVTTKE